MPYLFYHLPISGSSAPLPRLFALLSLFAFCICMPGLSAPSASDTPIPKSSTPLSFSNYLPMPELFAFSSLSIFDVHMPRLSVLSTFGAFVPGSSALLSFYSHLSLPELFAPSPSGCLPMPGLFLPFSNWSFPQTLIPILEK